MATVEFSRATRIYPGLDHPAVNALDLPGGFSTSRTTSFASRPSCRVDSANASLWAGRSSASRRCS